MSGYHPCVKGALRAMLAGTLTSSTCVVPESS
jgi:hypothetical protein